MEKIRVNNGQIFEIIPMGIDTNLFEKTRRFSFVSNLGYGEVESSFASENIGKIEYLSVSNEMLKTYADNIKLKSITKEFAKQIEDNIISDVYTVVLEIN